MIRAQTNGPAFRLEVAEMSEMMGVKVTANTTLSKTPLKIVENINNTILAIRSFDPRKMTKKPASSFKTPTSSKTLIRMKRDAKKVRRVQSTLGRTTG